MSRTDKIFDKLQVSLQKRHFKCLFYI